MFPFALSGLAALFLGQAAFGQTFSAEAPAGPVLSAPPPSLTAPRQAWQEPAPGMDGVFAADYSGGGGWLQSDRAFPRFVGPISNPVLAKDPRSLTEARLLFINDQIDSKSAVGPGSFQVAGMQLRLALTDRLTFIADKDGYAWIHPNQGSSQDGWLDIAAGLKYTVIRDVEQQMLLTAGLMWEPQTGEKRVFQNQGSGLFTGFLTFGKEFDEVNHVLVNAGYQLPADRSQNSSFYYASLHLDRQLIGWLYPLVELNWYHYTSGGDRGLPAIIGEGDGLLNLGTTGVAGNDLVTGAVGIKAQLCPNTETGLAWEVPLSSRHDLLNNRLLVELILRY